jgi:hypothetical protein
VFSTQRIAEFKEKRSTGGTTHPHYCNVIKTKELQIGQFVVRENKGSGIGVKCMVGAAGEDANEETGWRRRISWDDSTVGIESLSIKSGILK